MDLEENDNQAASGSGRTGVTKGTVSYKFLLDASAKYISKSKMSVQVSFGQPVHKVHLTRGGVNVHTFEDVLWEEPEQEELSSNDRYYIEKYTGHFDYSRNVGVVLRGITPYTEPEDPACKFNEQQDHAKLTEEVLQWTVGFGIAINKLPILPQPTPLWRGAWEAADRISNMATMAGSGGVYSVPWFQPMSSDQNYAPTFLQEKYQPTACRDAGCIKTEHSFPVLYEFHTVKARDLTEWNPKESEFMFLPNTDISILSVNKITNDIFLEMDKDELVAWLRRDDHRPVDPTDQKRFGPWTDLANAVKDKGWTGPRFLAEYSSGYTRDYKWKYLAHLGIDEDSYDYDLKGDLTMALRNRYKLPPLKGQRLFGWVSNSVPFYYAVVGEDYR